MYTGNGEYDNGNEDDTRDEQMDDAFKNIIMVNMNINNDAFKNINDMDKKLNKN